jgi:hypothetical protein
MAQKADEATVREAVGIFFQTEHLRAAIDELLTSGFERPELGLLAGEYTVQRALGDLYTRTNEFEDNPNAPCTAFVADESLDDTSHAWLGSLMLLGTTTTAGVAVATAGIFGGALLAAAAGAASMGAVGAVLGLIIHRSDADYLEEQVDEGHLLLFVRTRDAQLEQKAVAILSKHCAFDPRVYSVPACR